MPETTAEPYIPRGAPGTKTNGPERPAHAGTLAAAQFNQVYPAAEISKRRLEYRVAPDKRALLCASQTLPLMPSLVHSARDELVARGEYVVLANVASGWFAIFESTLRRQTTLAQKNGRVGPNLVVYRTRNQDTEPRDHHVIPYAILESLVTDETVAEAKVKSSRRWNLTLTRNQLRVTHSADSVDVAEFYRAPLLLEQSDEQRTVFGTVLSIQIQAVEALEGLAKEYTTVVRSRSGALREAALHASKGICEACGIDFSSLLDGFAARVLQVHHKNQLAYSPNEIVTNLADLAVVCANCHSLVHASREHPMPIENLRALWRRGRGDA